MRQSRNVAYDAAERLTEGAPGAIRPVPVWTSLRAGWLFLFRNPRRIFARVWVAAIILAILEAKLSIKIDLDAVSPEVLGSVLWLSLGYSVLYSLITASLYGLALGVEQRPMLAGLALGPDELRYLLTVFAFIVIACVLLLGATIVGAQIARLLSYTSGIARLSIPSDAADIQWFKDMKPLELLVSISPIAAAAAILVWFGLRYTFVPLHVIAARRLAIFDAMALTKRNTWRLLGLFLLLGITLQIAAQALIIALDFIAGTPVLMRVAESAGRAVNAFGEYAAAIVPGDRSNTVPRPVRLPAWLSPALLTVLNITALAITVGAVANAYKAVTGRAPANGSNASGAPAKTFNAPKPNFKLL